MNEEMIETIIESIRRKMFRIYFYEQLSIRIIKNAKALLFSTYFSVILYRIQCIALSSSRRFLLKMGTHFCLMFIVSLRLIGNNRVFSTARMAH